METTNFFRLLRTLRKHRHLSEKRDPIYETSKAAKWFVWISVSFVVLYLLMFAILFALDANDSRKFTSPEYILALSPFILSIDFWLRFIAQQTPSQIVKPYVLLPLPKYICIDSFIATSLLSEGNLIWFIMLVPFCLMSVVFSYGLLTALSLLLLFYILILADSQWYSIARTLTTQSMLWWLLPIGVTVAIFLPWLIFDFKTFMELYAGMGSGLESGNLIPHLVALLLLAGLVMINRKLQYKNVWRELGKTEATENKRIQKYSFLEKWGELGEYLKLEIKMLTRNKNPRKSFFISAGVVVVLSLVISFTDVYDNTYMTNFWCIYNLVIFAVVLLVKVMNFEGNYIDFLMVHKENLLKLLTAKYYFFCALLILPFTLMLPMVFVGKWNIMMLLSNAIFTAGFQHFVLMQAAVYNNKAVPLNEKFISKGGVENNYIQMIVGMVAFFLPMLILQTFGYFFKDTIAWGTMLGIGLLFIIFHKLWLRNIYNRLMKRRYKNMEAFHA